MIEDKNLEAILMKRDVPEPATNLAHRITSAALSKGAKKWDNFSLAEILMNLILIPKPAYVTGILLFMGVAVGLYSGDTDTTNQEWFSFLEAQEEEWL